MGHLVFGQLFDAHYCKFLEIIFGNPDKEPKSVQDKCFKGEMNITAVCVSMYLEANKGQRENGQWTGFRFMDDSLSPPH